MVRANNDIREAVKEAGVFLWQVADQYGISDINFSRLLRKPLSPEKKQRVLDIIDNLKKQEGR